MADRTASAIARKMYAEEPETITLEVAHCHGWDKTADGMPGAHKPHVFDWHPDGAQRFCKGEAEFCYDPDCWKKA